MTVELCHAGILELGCLIDLGWIQAPAWLTAALPSRQPAPAGSDGFNMRVRATADQLPLDQGRALWLVDVCGATYTEGVATETGVTPTSFASRVHSARDTIRRSLT